jgi:type VI secretion system protein ImpE
LIRLARKTEWIEICADTFEGRGQRVFTTDAGDFPLMDIRSIEWEHAGAVAEGAVGG